MAARRWSQFRNPLQPCLEWVALLVLFAFVAGAGTALTPCVLPVLPALLASAGTGGPRRPLAVIVGLVATFTLTIVALASLIDGVGLPNGTVRTLAVLVLLGFGLALLVPALAARIEAPSRGWPGSAPAATANAATDWSPACCSAPGWVLSTPRARARFSPAWCRCRPPRERRAAS